MTNKERVMTHIAGFGATPRSMELFDKAYDAMEVHISDMPVEKQSDIVIEAGSFANHYAIEKMSKP